MKKTKIALWIVVGVLILAFFTAEIVGLSIYKKKRHDEMPYLENKFWVEIKAEYDEKFLSGEISLADLKYDDIKCIEYQSNTGSAYGDLYIAIIELKTSGFLNCTEAMSYMESLEFVIKAHFILNI